jgi:hypothetical protein
MTVIAEINDRRVARKMLEHVGLPSDAPEQWPARRTSTRPRVERGTHEHRARQVPGTPPQRRRVGLSPEA